MSIRVLPNYNIQGIGSVEEAFSQLKINLLDLLDMCSDDEPSMEDISAAKDIPVMTEVQMMDANLIHLRGYYERIELLTEQSG